MASTLETWEQSVRVIPSNESLPLAPLEGEEDILHALEQTSGDPVFYVWNGTSFAIGVGPHPHPHVD